MASIQVEILPFIHTYFYVEIPKKLNMFFNGKCFSSPQTSELVVPGSNSASPTMLPGAQQGHCALLYHHTEKREPRKGVLPSLYIIVTLHCFKIMR